MARIVSPGSTRSEGSGPSRSRSFFVTDLIRRHGLRAILAIFVAAFFAFAPLVALYWFNAFLSQSVLSVAPGHRVVVKTGQHYERQEREEPGETALLQVACDVPSFDEWKELLGDGDPARSDSTRSSSRSVRREAVYLRRAGSSRVPFGLLGSPPVSAWLPAGDYEILVVYEAPTNESRIDLPGRSFPWLSVFAECSLEARQKTVCRIQLPHYDWGNPDSLLGVGTPDEAAERKPLPEELATLLAACETMTAIPTPAGYVLNLAEPRIHHQKGHRGCVQDFHELQRVPREWTRDQIVKLRHWLPVEADSSKARLTTLIDRLEWRTFLEGWFCYALAGVSGVVFTRWGAIALLEPWRRGGWYESFWLLVRSFLISAAAAFVLEIFSGLSCHRFGPFRRH